MKIEPGRFMNDFIEPNKRQYMIPVYQRNYEWSSEQCTKLFEDVVAAYKNDKEHFCGSFIYSNIKKENKIDYYIIIDGQQRMTTIFLLIKALLDCAESDRDKEIFESIIVNQDKFNTYGIDAASKLKLKPIKSDNNQLLLLMENNFDEIDKSCGIWHNYELFCKLVSEQQSHDMGVREIYQGLQNLICVDISLGENDNAQEIFERINSTGIPLSLADKIRNYVLMTDVNQEELYEDYWLKTETLVGKSNLTDFFLSFLNFKMDDFSNAKDAYDDFKKLYVTKHYDNAAMIKEIHHYAKYYNAIVRGDKKYSEELNKALQSLIRLKQTTHILFLYRVFDDMENGIVDENEVVKLLNFMVNYSIRRIVCNIPSNSLRGLYKTLYSRAFNRDENKNTYVDTILSFFHSITSRDAFISDEEFVSALKKSNLYGKNALCKFLLSEIENHGKEHLQTDNLTIEHILPQNKNLSKSWQVMLGDKWEDDRDRLLHTLGNLTLTAYNSELGDKPFDEKKELIQNNTKAVVLFEDIKSCEKWDATAIERRAENLSKKILALYPTMQPMVKVSFNNPNYQEYSCDDPSLAKYKYPNSYIFQGEIVKVSNFKEMLRSLAKRLYQLDPGLVEELARTNEQFIKGWSAAIFSYDKSKVYKSNYKLDGTEIYGTSNNQADNVMLIIRELLDRFDIDRNEFCYSAKISNDSVITQKK